MTETTDTSATTLWIAYRSDGAVVGAIRRDDSGYTVTMADADAALGTYPSLTIAKNALHGHLPHGAERPVFRER